MDGLSEAEIRVDEINKITALWAEQVKKAATHREMVLAIVEILRERTRLASELVKI